MGERALVKPMAPKPDASLADLAQYLHDKHLCDEAHFEKATEQREAITRKISFDGKVNILTLLAMLGGLATAGWTASTWMARVENKLNQVAVNTAQISVQQLHLQKLDDAVDEFRRLLLAGK